MNGNPDRHEIINDPLFWHRLGGMVCDWLWAAEDSLLRGCWIDDFIPESAANTKYGADVEGIAWVGAGPREMHPYRFIVSVPQKMLHRRRDSFSIGSFILDPERRVMQVEINHENHAA